MKEIEINPKKSKQQLASNSVEFVKIKNITPVVAQWMIANQVSYNRNLDKRNVSNMVRDMIEGNWHPDAPGSIICFDKRGSGVSLQHRMEAVIKSGTTIDYMYAQLGCSNPEYGDLGKARTMTDRLHMNGVSAGFNKAIATVVRNILHIMDDKVPSTTSPKNEYSYAEIASFVEENRDNLKELYQWSAKIYETPDAKKIVFSWGGSRLRRVCVESYMFYLHFVAGWDWQLVYNFFKTITSTVPSDHPVLEKVRSMFFTNSQSRSVAKFSTLYIDYAIRVYFNTYALGNLKATKVLSPMKYMETATVNRKIEKFCTNVDRKLKVM